MSEAKSRDKKKFQEKIWCIKLDFIKLGNKKRYIMNGTLDLSKLKILDIAEIEGLENLTHLKNLNLEYNQINKITGLEDFGDLVRLHLGHNQIEKISGLEHLTKLEELDLSYNRIREITRLAHLENLQKLNLSFNKITEIKGLERLTNLKILPLNRNAIKYIKGLETLTQLEQLHFDSNEIKEIKGLDTLSNLWSLSFANNEIEEIKGVDTLSKLKILVLKGNKIKEIQGLDNMVELQTLDLNYNRIEEIKGLEALTRLFRLSFYGNPIRDEEEFLIGKATGFVVSYCQRKKRNFFLDSIQEKIEQEKIDFVVFRGRKYPVDENRLDLSNAEITDINEIKGLEKLTNLSELNLENNRIKEIKGLQDLTILKTLKLGKNRIEEPKGLDNFKTLQILDLRENLIKEIKGLWNLNNLNELNVGRNKIIQIKGLERLHKLTMLEFSFNKVREIKGLENLTNLEYLGLNFCGITEIKNLEKLTKLKQLWLQNNHIKQIQGLEALASLEKLYLTRNHLEEIKELENLTNLSKLCLGWNRIEEIKGLEKLVKLERIYLNNNRIQDDEKHWLAKEAQEIVRYCQEKARLSKLGLRDNMIKEDDTDISEILDEIENKLGFTIQPLNRIYGKFFFSYGFLMRYKLYTTADVFTYFKLDGLKNDLQPPFGSDPMVQEFLNWITVRSADDLFKFVNIFYTATLLYYRLFPIVHWYASGEGIPFVPESADIEGYERLVKFETAFSALEGIESVIVKQLKEWNARTKEACQKLSQLKNYNKYSIQLSEFFRDEIIARVEFYKTLREELAKTLNKDIRDFSDLHMLFVRYYGSMGFFEMIDYLEPTLRDWDSSFNSSTDLDEEGYYAVYDLYPHDDRGMIDTAFYECRNDEAKLNRKDYQLEYFAAVQEYYKEVIKCTLNIVDQGQYSNLQKKNLMKYIIKDYLVDLLNMEDIFEPKPQTEHEAGTYWEFWYFGEISNKCTGTIPSSKLKLKTLKNCLEILDDFIEHNPIDQLYG